MALSKFGIAVRKARLDSGDTLESMAKEIGCTRVFLSGLETGKKHISEHWLDQIQLFFYRKNVNIFEGLDQLADLSNKKVDLSLYSYEKRALIVKLARMDIGINQWNRIENILNEDCN